MFGSPYVRNFLAVTAVASLGLAYSANAQAQALQADTQVAASSVQTSANACMGALDQPVIDPALLIKRCTSYIDTADASPGLQAAAHLVRAAAYRDIGEDQHARADDLEAIRLYTSVIDVNEPYPEFVFRRGTAYHALGDIKNALRDYDIAIKGNPWNVIAFADRGILLSKYYNQFNLAAADFDQALKLAPDNVQLLILRGDTYAIQNKFDAALADLDRAVSLEPRNPAVYTHRASAQSRKGATDAALKDYEKALAIDPDNFDALLSRSALYAESGDGKSALADADRALVARPGNASALYNRGYANFVLRRYDEAIKDYSAAIESVPDFGMAYTNRCLNAALAGKDRDHTLADCNQAVSLLPARAETRETRGFANLKYGDNQAAISDYDAALKGDANRPLSLYGRGIARVRMGDKEEGLADKQAARKLYPNVDREFAPFGID